MMNLPIDDLRFTSRQEVGYLNCERRREESLMLSQFETRHLLSYQEK
jgi:hypothetical protein